MVFDQLKRVSTPRTSQSRADLILWDVIEEHLDEAEFLFERWNRALFQPGIDLNDLACRFEPRLLAHLDAVLVGGIEVARQVLLPELHAPKDPIRTTVSALALLSDPRGSWIEEVIRIAQQSEEGVQQSLIRALILADCAPLDSKLRDRFDESPADPVLLEIMTGRGLDPGICLRHCLESRDPKVVFVGRKAVHRFGRRELYYLAGIDSNKDCAPLHLHEIKEQLELPTTIESALWQLGFCGTVEAGDFCSSYLKSDNPRLVKLAVDSMAWIGGLNLSDPKLKLSSKDAAARIATSSSDIGDDDSNSNLELDGVDDIPLPNTKAIERWWYENRQRFVGYRRCLLGRPFSIESVRFALESGALWRRHSLALELCAQTDGRMHVSTDAFSSRQFRQLAALVA
jgi:hypothetical protein